MADRELDDLGPGWVIFLIAPALFAVLLLWWFIKWLDEKKFDGRPVIAKTVGYSILSIMVVCVFWVFFGDTGSGRVERLELIGEALFAVFIALPWYAVLLGIEWFSSG